MAYNAGSILARIKAGTSGLKSGINTAKRGLKDLSNTAKTAANGIKRAGALATAALAGIGTAGGFLIKAASDAKELQNVIEVSFGAMADDINEWAEQTAEAVNRSDYAIKNYVGTSMSMLKNMVESKKEAAEMSKAITKLAVDLSSFRNIKTDRAFEALTGALTGEAEALKRLGFNTQQAALEQYALKNGIEKSVREMTESEKVMLRYNVIMEKMSEIQGDAVRTRDELANSWRGFLGEVRNAREELGSYLLPIATKVVNKAREAIKAFNELPDSIHQNIVQIGLFATGLLSAIAGLAGLVIGIEAIIGALSVVASAFVSLTNPVTIIIALAYTFYSAWKQNLWGVRDYLDQLWNNFKEWYDNIMNGGNKTASYFFDKFKSAFNSVWKILKWLINRNLDFYVVVKNVAVMSYEVVKNNWDKIAKFIGGVLDWIMKKLELFGVKFASVADNVEKSYKNVGKEHDGFLGQILEGVGEDHIANIGKNLDKTFEIVKEKAPEIAGEIKKWSEKAKKGMGELWEAMKQTAKDTFDEILILVKQRAPELYKQIKKIVDAFKGKLTIDVDIGDKKGGADKGGMGPIKVGDVPEKLPTLSVWEKFVKVINRAKNHYAALKKEMTWKNMTERIKSAREQFIRFKNQMISGLSAAIAKGKSLSKVFDNFLDQVASLVIQKAIVGPAVNSVLSFAGFPTAHNGGLVTARGLVDAYHSGGMVGLKPLANDERLIKAQTGELILSREDTKAFLNNQGSGGETYNININAVDAKSFADLAARNPEAITGVVNNDIKKNGLTRKTIKQNL